jgi:Right handed beta helix region
MKMNVLASVCLSLLIASTASAQIARVFLSGTGTDAGDCSVQTSPCRSLQYAVTQVPVNGEILVLDNGGYGGATITKSLTVNASAGVVAFVARTITVAIGSGDKVVLRGLSMNGVVFGDSKGIAFTSGGTLVVENSVIAGFGLGPILVQGSGGISQSGPGSNLVVYNCEFRNNSEAVVTWPQSSTLTTATVENSRFSNNTFSVLGELGLVNVNVRNSVFSFNYNGVFAYASVAGQNPTILVDTCTIAHNTFGVGVQTLNGAIAVVDVTNSTIQHQTGVGIDIETSNAFVYSFGNNHVRFNNSGSTFSGTVGLQ